MKRRFLENTWRRDPAVRKLCEAFLACRTPEDIANFLRDIATLSEIKALSERLEVATLLARGLPYREVADRTRASTTTVTRVAQFLFGGEGGYRKIFGALHHHAPFPHSVRSGRHGASKVGAIQ